MSEKPKTQGRPKVAIVTSLIDYSPAYSLGGIILDQARTFQRQGYDYDLLCLKNFNHQDRAAMEGEGLSIKYILPQTTLVDYKPNQPAEPDHPERKGRDAEGFEAQVRVHFEGRPETGEIGYRDALEPYDVVIDHDLMFLSWHLPQNGALRKAIDLWPEKTWLHWVHSGPSSPPGDLCYPSTLRFSAAPHSTYVYLNETQRLDYSLMIQAPKKAVRCVYNPKDLRDVFGFSQDTCEVISRYDLFDHELLQVYPFSTPRWRDKGVRQLLKIFGFWKQQKARARLVLVNAHCNSAVDKPRVEAMEAYAKTCGLVLDDDVILTSRYADGSDRNQWRYTVPFRVVRELMTMSNLFIFPSVSECCSLIQAEAAITGGKFVVLNRDFPAMVEFGHPTCLTYEFSKNDPDRNPIYYECVAREILANIRSESTIMVTTKARNELYNRDRIFREQLEPLLYLGFSERERKAAERPREVLRPEFQKPVIEVEAPDGSIHKAVIEKVVRTKRSQPSQTSPSAGEIEVAVKEPERADVDYSDPYDGMKCTIFGECSGEQRAECFKLGGHCIMLDELKVEA